MMITDKTSVCGIAAVSSPPGGETQQHLCATTCNWWLIADISCMKSRN